jgi:hypothetical protein
MVYIRGRASDYDRWAAPLDAGGFGCSGWSWNDLLPYFIKSENNERLTGPLHGQGGPLNVADLRSPSPFGRVFIDAAVQAGFREVADFNTGDQEGVGAYQVTQKGGERCSAARAYLEPARSRPNLTVFTGAHVLKVKLAGGRATGVEFGMDGLLQTASAAREVILCAGALQSPQLLMCSGIGPKAHLIEAGVKPMVNAPLVGANLHDHIDYIINRKFHSRNLFGLSAGAGLDRRTRVAGHAACAGHAANARSGAGREMLQHALSDSVSTYVSASEMRGWRNCGSMSRSPGLLGICWRITCASVAVRERVRPADQCVKKGAYKPPGRSVRRSRYTEGGESATAGRKKRPIKSFVVARTPGLVGDVSSIRCG